MARAPSRLRAQLAVLVVTVAVAVAAALWVNSVGDGAGEETIRLDEPAVNPSRSGDELPAVELHDADDRSVTLETDGRPMVVNLWFADCAPCARELGDFADVHGEVGDRVRFVGVDPIDDVERMTSFAAERGVTYELLRGVALADELGVVGYPVTLFVDGDGTIVDQTGPITAAELRDRIEASWP